MGRNWSDIVNRYLPGRTALASKNRFPLLHRRIESAQIATKARENAGTSPASSSVASTPSNAVEDNDFDFMDINGDAMSTSREDGQETTGYLNSPSFGADIILGLSAPQTLRLGDGNSYPTLQFPYRTLRRTANRNIPTYLTMPLGTKSTPLGRLPTWIPLDLLQIGRFRLTAQQRESSRSEKVMGCLTKLVNNMMMQGDVNDVNFSTVEA
ncbi:hypothetical protein F4804DRAFT_352712 [Jackrogersella minutella]|nr:hypothetical protein F4804DRAFT_352712 [Jackrogersella minutella]